MAMPLNEYNRLRKLMMMTTSDNDAEALSALRKANAVLASYSYTWNSAFDRLVRVDVPIEAADPEPRTANPREDPASREVRELLERVEATDPRGDAADFVASLREQFDRRGSLSVKQVAALQDVLDRKGRRRVWV